MMRYHFLQSWRQKSGTRRYPWSVWGRGSTTSVWESQTSWPQGCSVSRRVRPGPGAVGGRGQEAPWEAPGPLQIFSHSRSLQRLPAALPQPGCVWRVQAADHPREHLPLGHTQPPREARLVAPLLFAPLWPGCHTLYLRGWPVGPCCLLTLSYHGHDGGCHSLCVRHCAGSLS